MLPVPVIKTYATGWTWWATAQKLCIVSLKADGRPNEMGRQASITSLTFNGPQPRNRHVCRSCADFHGTSELMRSNPRKHAPEFGKPVPGPSKFQTSPLNQKTFIAAWLLGLFLEAFGFSCKVVWAHEFRGASLRQPRQETKPCTQDDLLPSWHNFPKTPLTPPKVPKL